MSARVYLMADRGDGHGPVQVGTTSRAWWLVEAESADAARDLIAEHVACGIVAADVKHGRILASGGGA